MRSAILRLAPLALLALAACASTPRAADVSLPGGFEAPAGAPAGTIALDTWWTAFDDAELTALVEQALARNTDVRLARGRLQEARAQRSGSIYQYLPQGDARASASRTRTEQIGGTAANIPGFSTSGTSERYSATFDVSWEVDPYGRAFIGLDAADAEVDQVRFAYEATRAQVASQVADAWFLARGLAIQLSDAQETARIQQELYDAATKRVAVGLTPGSDADRFASELAQAKASIAQLEAQLQVQKRAILILAGRVVEPTANINAPPQVGQPPAVPNAFPSELLERRPDIRQAQARVRSQTKQLKLADLAFFPSFVLAPGIGWSKIVQPNFSSETEAWTLAGSVMQPVLSIPRLLAEQKAQGARAEQAVTNYEKAVQTAFQEAEDALVTLDSDKRRVVLFAEGEVRARRAFNAARIGYDRGLTDLDTLLQTEQTWRQIRTQLTAAQVQALRRTVQAYKALGGGWPTESVVAQGGGR